MGVRVGESQFSHMLPCPQDSPTPLVIPQAALCPRGNPEAKSWPNGPPPARHLELRRFWRSFCSCSRRRLSSLTGLGMKPTSQPSFTSRPIHQSLLYFCKQRQVGWERPRGRLEVQASSHPAGETTLGVAYPAQGVAPSKSPTPGSGL